MLQAQAQACRSSVGDEVLVALYGRELHEGLQTIRQQRGDPDADARPIARRTFPLEREAWGGRSLDQPSIDVALAIRILMDPGSRYLRHHDAVGRVEAHGRLHTQAALQRGLIKIAVPEFQTGIAFFLKLLEPVVRDGEAEPRADRQAAERVIIAGEDPGGELILIIVC